MEAPYRAMTVGHLRIAVFELDRQPAAVGFGLIVSVFYNLAMQKVDHVVQLDDGRRWRNPMIRRFQTRPEADSVADELASLATVCMEAGLLHEIDWRKELSTLRPRPLPGP